MPEAGYFDDFSLKMHKGKFAGIAIEELPDWYLQYVAEHEEIFGVRHAVAASKVIDWREERGGHVS